MINLVIKVNSREINSLFGKIEKDIRKGLLKGTRDAAKHARDEVRSGMDRGLYIKNWKYVLNPSLDYGVDKVGTKYVGEVTSDVVYSAIHEFGGMAGPNRLVSLRATGYASKPVEDAADDIVNIVGEQIEKAFYGV